jgi:predicted  nucleic acid-binding Zn-ribbon protein
MTALGFPARGRRRAAARDAACGACFTAIPRNRRSQIRAGTHIEGCEACGVILYPVDGEE